MSDLLELSLVASHYRYRVQDGAPTCVLGLPVKTSILRPQMGGKPSENDGIIYTIFVCRSLVAQPDFVSRRLCSMSSLESVDISQLYFPNRKASCPAAEAGYIQMFAIFSGMFVRAQHLGADIGWQTGIWESSITPKLQMLVSQDFASHLQDECPDAGLNIEAVAMPIVPESDEPESEGGCEDSQDRGCCPYLF